MPPRSMINTEFKARRASRCAACGLSFGQLLPFRTRVHHYSSVLSFSLLSVSSFMSIIMISLDLATKPAISSGVRGAFWICARS